MDSIAKSGVVSAYCHERTWNVPKACAMAAVDSLRSASASFEVQQDEWDRYSSLTVHDGLPMLDKTVDNFESLSGSRATLVRGEPVQPLEGSLDVFLSAKLLYKFLCVSLSRVSFQRRTNSLNRPCLTCLVARARVESSSTIIFTNTFVKAGVEGISV